MCILLLTPLILFLLLKSTNGIIKALYDLRQFSHSCNLKKVSKSAKYKYYAEIIPHDTPKLYVQ